MQKANDYREKQVISLSDKIVKLQETEKTMKAEKADWFASKKKRDDELEAVNAQIFAAKEAHKALCKLHDADKEVKEAELADIQRKISDSTEIYSHSSAENAVELIKQDEVIRSRKETVDGLVVQERNLRLSVSRHSTDKVLALKDAAAALDENRRAVKKLSDTEALITQAEKDHDAGEKSRRAEALELGRWRDRLDVRENDLNVITDRMKPEFVKVFGETKVNAHVFKPSRP